MHILSQSEKETKFYADLIGFETYKHISSALDLRGVKRILRVGLWYLNPRINEIMFYAGHNGIEITEV